VKRIKDCSKEGPGYFPRREDNHRGIILKTKIRFMFLSVIGI
jgi:hypothetical protein